MFKRIIASLVILIVMIQILSPIYANNLFERRSTPVTLAQGVTQQTIQRYTTQGWININLIRAQLTDAIKFDVLTGPNLTTRTSLSAMLSEMNMNDTAIAAINADYFDLSLNTTLGNVVKDGKILTTSVGFTDTQKLASFNIDYQHLANIAYTQSYSHSMTNGTVSHPIDFFNKPLLHSGVTILYDRSFFPVSYGNTLKTVSYIHEMLVVDGIIQDIRINKEPFEIPENGYVIASTGNRLESIKVIYEIGDRIDIHYDPLFSAHQLMMGGGAQIVANGAALTKFSLESPGRHPRTAVGVSKNRKEVLLVTIDGRTQGFAGVTLTELAQIMVELGAYEALNMDGGGSTQMMARLPFNDTIRTINYPSDGSQRSIYTGLVIERVIKENPTPMTLVFAANQSLGYLGSAKGFKVNVFDSNMTPLDVTTLDIKWQAEGLEGTWNGSTFVPQSAGKGKITATYGSLKSQIDFEVVQGAVALVVKPEILQIAPGESQKLSFWVESEKGTLIPISPNLIKADFANPVATFDANTGSIHVKNAGDPSYIAFSFERVKNAYISIHNECTKDYSDF
jgi:exopolysaccharide biosynthesis protein